MLKTGRRRNDHQVKAKNVVRCGLSKSGHCLPKMAADKAGRSLSQPLVPDAGKTSFYRRRATLPKVTGTVLYRIDELDQWVEAKVFTSTSDISR